MKQKRQYFGTDGIRGRVGEYPITPDFVLKLGWATGRVFAGTGNRKVLVGKDTRISGYMFESALEAGLTAAGVDINLLGPMPTPAVAYLTRTFHAAAGIVISASHNNYEDNGFKFFSVNGTKLDDDVELAIEAMLQKDIKTVESSQIGKASRINDASGRYIEFCKSTVPGNIGLSGMKVVLDCAHGATYQVAPSVFRELGAQVIVLGNRPDGLNINNDCGSTSPDQLRKAVLRENASLGIAFDGDGDRVVMIDHKGEVVDGDELLYIIASSRLKGNDRGQGVVGTEMSNLGLELALRKEGIPFRRTKVGDRYVMSELVTRQWLYGGESSGHIICLDSTTTGDGIVSALQVLKAMRLADKPLHDLKQGMTKFPMQMINVRVEDKGIIDTNPAVVDAVKSIEAEMQGKGRVLLRASGTEPVVRVMIEGEDEMLVSRLVRELAGVVETAASGTAA